MDFWQYAIFDCMNDPKTLEKALFIEQVLITAPVGYSWY